MNQPVYYFNGQCCVCRGHCAHSGSHSYCPDHAPKTTVLDSTGPMPVFNPPGQPSLGHSSLTAPTTDARVLIALQEILELAKEMRDYLKEIKYNSNKL